MPDESKWPPGDGEMAALIRTHDWAATPLGPIAQWDDRLKAAVEMVLASPLVSSVAFTPDRLLLYNDAAANLYGANHPSALGRPLRESFADSYAVVAPLYDRVFAGESVAVLEQPLAVGTDGVQRIFDAYLMPVRAADGSVFGAHMVGPEIGDRIRAEEALRESENSLYTVLNGVAEAFYALDAQWRFLFVSRAALKIWNKQSHEIIGKTLLDAFPGIESSEPYRAHLRVMQFRQPEHMQTVSPVIHRWVEVDIAPTPTGGVSVAFRDIEDRKRAEAAARESEERFRLFVENVREYALVQTDLEGLITSWNPGAERLSGYSSAEVVGRPFVLLLPEEDRDAEMVAREMVTISRGERNIDTHTMQRKDGSRFWAEWATEPVFDDHGKLRGTAKVIRDETERQRTTLLVRNSLAEKEELLKEVHHRVKNNLQVIMSVLNLQASSITDDRVLSAFQEMRNRVQSIASIHELLYRSTSFASISLVSYTKRLLSSLIQFYGSESRVDGQVTGDADAAIELERAVPFGLMLNELISNALKHGFSGATQGALHVVVESSGTDTILRVSNTGAELPPGFSAERTDTLGLRLVQILARQLRGELRNVSGRDVTFEVRFPATDLARS